MNPWKKIKSEVVLDQPPFLRVENHTVQAPGGEVIGQWAWLVTPDYVNIIPITEEGQFICLRETKYGIDGPSLAAVGGFVETGEDPREAACRELMEETGYRASGWRHLGDFRVDCNRGVGTAHFYVATGAVGVAAPASGDLEEHEVVLLSREELLAALTGGEFKSLSWAAAVSLALHAVPGR